jgi:agmatinase
MSDERYAPYQEFLGVPANLKPEAESRVAILPVPYDLTTSYQPGARRGPLAILEASTHLETYDEELGRETWE